jgi:hypothetical protein
VGVKGGLVGGAGRGGGRLCAGCTKIDSLLESIQNWQLYATSVYSVVFLGRGFRWWSLQDQQFSLSCLVISS